MRRVSKALTFALGACIFALLVGCAAPGDPTPRHPIVPLPVSDLTVRQSGSDAVLNFSLPTRSVDREALPEVPTIEIYRAPLRPGAIPDRKTQWRLVDTIPSERTESYEKDNHVEFRDPLGANVLDNSSGNLLAYMVRTRVVKVRASVDSNSISVHVYPAPGTPRDVHAAVTELAIVVTWTGTPPPAGASSEEYRVYRAERQAGAESSQDVAQSELKASSVLLGPSSTTEFRDPHFEFGTTYVYTVRAAARFGTEFVESTDSSPVVVAARDVFPPAAPGGVEGTIIPSTPQLPVYVELSWAISPETDLAGYYVYRSSQENLTGDRLNQDLTPSPTYRDNTVASGAEYYYRVSAVDRAGNESPKSSAVRIAVP